MTTMAANYPLVRITNDARGHVFYTRTQGHSTMGIAPAAGLSRPRFDVPAAAETGSIHKRKCQMFRRDPIDPTTPLE